MIFEAHPADPPIPADGSCAHCGGRRRVRPNRYSGLQARLDPFCSTLCCKLHYGVVFGLPVPKGRNVAA